MSAKRYAKCPTQGKDMYPTQRVAIRVLLSCSRKRGQALRVYFHRDCKSYHLTSKARDNDNRGAVA